jgi:hypothetical protein
LLKTQQPANSQTNLRVKDARDGVWDVLGFGCDVTGEYGNTSSTTFKVIDVAKLYQIEPTRLVTNLNTTRNSILSYGGNAESYSSQLSSRLTATAAYKLFKGSLTAAYGNTTSLSAKYAYGSYSLLMQQKELKFNAVPTLLQSYLTDVFRADIVNNTPAQIVQQYGAFVLSDIMLGAKLEITYQSETSSSDRTTAASGGLDISVGKVFSISTGINSTTSQSSSNYNQYLHYLTHGGDPRVGITPTTISFTQSTPTVDYSAWQNSTNFQNAEFIDLNKDGLIPIYSLIPDPNKAAAVKAYVTQFLANNQVQVTYSTFPEGQFVVDDFTGQYFIEIAGLLRYIPDPTTLDNTFTFTNSSFAHYNTGTLANYRRGANLPSYPYTCILKDLSNGRMYFREGYYLRYIPNFTEAARYHLNLNKALNIANLSVSNWTYGPDM